MAKKRKPSPCQPGGSTVLVKDIIQLVDDSARLAIERGRRASPRGDLYYDALESAWRNSPDPEDGRLRMKAR